MVPHNQQSKTECHSVRWDPQKGASIQLTDPASNGDAPTSSRMPKACISEKDSKGVPMLSNEQLVQTLGQIWGYASHPLSSKKSVEHSKVDGSRCQNDNIVGILNIKEIDQEHVPDYPPPRLQSVVEFLRVTQKVSGFDILKKDCDPSSPLGTSPVGTESYTGLLQNKGISCVLESNELRNMYTWMNCLYVHGYYVKYCFRNNIQEDKNGKDYNVSVGTYSCPSSSCKSGERPILPSRSSDSGTALVKHRCFSSCDDINPVSRKAATSLKANCSGQVTDAIVEDLVSRATSFSPIIDQHFCPAATSADEYGECIRNRRDQLTERTVHWSNGLDVRNSDDTNVSSELDNRSHMIPVKQQHAVAGAMAGVCVSLCLHPVDTLKTVVQSCQIDQKSIYDVGRSIVSERGLTGLYRGIASNIASSAPISAVYTFTYESVKGALLPRLPKEYHSVAHCTAGGCASIATSFIFTPSERIKQQMQVRAHYQNCWYALLGVIQKGGLPSLYAGWGAVLCRNVPHSIIKFYAYENMKGWLMSSLQRNELDTLQTLACGGIAGSTAALFTTPFDVVKTRLQTQIPGSANQYRGVFHAIQEIGKKEGLKGLYRGLAPRLIMYMTQGGLFFSSYEFFKRTLGLGTPQQST